MPLLDFFWSILWITLFILWIWLVITVFIDIFRSDDLSGWGKALWTIFVIILPLLGVLIYLIVRGGSMQDRAVRDAMAQKQATDDYIRTVAGGGASPADELSKLASLRDQGVITDDEYQQQKAKLLA
jgi:hypothetical protein